MRYRLKANHPGTSKRLQTEGTWISTRCTESDQPSWRTLTKTKNGRRYSIYKSRTFVRKLWNCSTEPLQLNSFKNILILNHVNGNLTVDDAAKTNFNTSGNAWVASFEQIGKNWKDDCIPEHLLEASTTQSRGGSSKKWQAKIFQFPQIRNSFTPEYWEKPVGNNMNYSQINKTKVYVNKETKICHTVSFQAFYV